MLAVTNQPQEQGNISVDNTPAGALTDLSPTQFAAVNRLLITNSQLQVENADLKIKLRDLVVSQNEPINNSIQEPTKEVAQLRNENSALIQEVQKLRDSLIRLEQQEKGSSGENKRLTQDSDRKKATIAELRSHNILLGKTISEQKVTIDEQVRELVQLRKEIEELQSTLAANNGSVSE